jgi:hypothetical protein
LGAFHQDKLVAVMTFDNNRAMNGQVGKAVYELRRFATDTSFRVVGIGSRLFKTFVREYTPAEVVSFADRRWTLDPTDNFYVTLGFVLDKTLGPDYTYFNSKLRGEDKIIRHHKFRYGKNRLKALFPDVYHPDMSEWEIMRAAGYDRIWDCGKFRYVWKAKEPLN